MITGMHVTLQREMSCVDAIQAVAVSSKGERAHLATFEDSEGCVAAWRQILAQEDSVTG